MKEELLRTALKLFKEEGYNQVSIQKICDVLHVTKGCFYHNYRSKEDLLLDYYEMIPKESVDTVLSRMLTEEDITKKLWMYFEFYVVQSVSMGADLLKELMKISMDRGGILFTPYYESSQPAVPGFLKIVKALTEAGQSRGEFTSCATWEQLLFIYTTSFSGALMHWSASRGNFDVVEELHRSYLHIYSARN